ncbi:MAG: M20 family metallopeptidase [Chloroflexi bacterium]|nr:M20 family metallopeptidase [Chloroflexota bacterium]
MPTQIKQFEAHFAEQTGAMVWMLSGLIETETPSSDKDAIDELGDWMSTWAADLAADVKVYPQSAVGNLVECRWNATAPGKPILILCHMDTVHPIGSVDKHPTHTEGERLYGMGAYDMKGGITVAQTVIQELIKHNQLPERPISLFLNSEEEIGSRNSRGTIEEIAQEAGLVLVMEPSPGPGKIVTARKGVGIFQMVALGRASHSGSAPENGVNAIVEISYQVGKITALTNWELGTTVIPTIIHGGVNHNVIPDECDITINVRARYQSEADRVSQALYDISHQAYLEDSLLYLTGDFLRPPMEHNALMEQTVATLREAVPMPIEEFSKGGGSDGNFTAALGIPTLDGLGPTGGGAHSKDEYIDIPSLPRQAALLSHILCQWPHMPRDGE